MTSHRQSWSGTLTGSSPSGMFKWLKAWTVVEAALAAQAPCEPEKEQRQQCFQWLGFLTKKVTLIKYRWVTESAVIERCVDAHPHSTVWFVPKAEQARSFCADGPLRYSKETEFVDARVAEQSSVGVWEWLALTSWLLPCPRTFMKWGWLASPWLADSDEESVGFQISRGQGFAGFKMEREAMGASSRCHLKIEIVTSARRVELWTENTTAPDTSKAHNLN